MNPEIGKLLGQLKKFRLVLYVNEAGQLKMNREAGTSGEIPADFLAGMTKHKVELTAVLTGGTRPDEARRNEREWPERCRQCGWAAYESAIPDGCGEVPRCPYKTR